MPACALLWSSAGLFIKIVTWNPFAIAGVRSFIGALVMLVAIRKPRFTWSFAQIAGAVCYAACMIGFVTANKLTTAANAILLQYTAPLWVAAFGWIFLKEKAGIVDWVTIAVVLGGMVLFFLDKLTLGGMQGNILAIASGVFFGGAIVSFRAQKEGSSLESILLSHVITMLVSLPFLWQGRADARRVGRACLPRRLPDRHFLPPALLRREAGDGAAVHPHRRARADLQSAVGLPCPRRAAGAARPDRRRRHPGGSDGTIRAQPSIGGPPARFQLTRRTPARITTPPTAWLQTRVSPRSTTPPSTPTTGMRLT